MAADQGSASTPSRSAPTTSCREVAQRFDGDLLVLTPWRPFGAALEVDPALAGRVIHTVSRLEDLADLLGRQPDARFVLERLTSMLRHGLTARELWAAAELARAAPAAPGSRASRSTCRSRQGSHLGEVQPAAQRRGRRRARRPAPSGSATSPTTSWPRCARRTPTSPFRPRIGTGLWLGDRGALRVTATVLDVHPVERGDVFGYRGRTAPKAGHLWSSAAAPRTASASRRRPASSSLKARAATLARGGLDAVGLRALAVHRSTASSGSSPSRRTCRPRCCSCRTAPAVPEVGDEVDVRVRYTATTFDRVVIAG